MPTIPEQYISPLIVLITTIVSVAGTYLVQRLTHNVEQNRNNLLAGELNVKAGATAQETVLSSLKGMREEIDAAQKAQNSLYQTVTQLRTDNGTLFDQQAQAKRDLNTALEDLAEAKEEIATLKNELETVVKKNETVNKQLIETQADLTRAQADAIKSRTEAADLQRRLTHAEQQIAELTDGLGVLEQQIIGLNETPRFKRNQPKGGT